MSNGRQVEKPCIYQIRVKGSFTPEWSIWFEGFSVTHQPQGESLLIGQIADQAALHGLLARLARLGIPLLELIRLDGFREVPESRSEEKGENSHEQNHS